jgi:hypothetical protein
MDPPMVERQSIGVNCYPIQNEMMPLIHSVWSPRHHVGAARRPDFGAKK